MGVILAVVSVGCGGSGDETPASTVCQIVDWAAVIIAVADDANTPVAGLRIAYWPKNLIGSDVREATTDAAGFAMLQATYVSQPGTGSGECENWTYEYDFGPACMVNGVSRVVVGSAKINALYSELPGSRVLRESMPAPVYYARLSSEQISTLAPECFSTDGQPVAPPSSPLLAGRDVCYCACLCYGTAQFTSGYSGPTGAMVLITERNVCSLATCDQRSNLENNIYLNGGVAEGAVGAASSGSCYP